jgi:hypothetical protein
MLTYKGDKDQLSKSKRIEVLQDGVWVGYIERATRRAATGLNRETYVVWTASIKPVGQAVFQFLSSTNGLRYLQSKINDVINNAKVIVATENV